MLVMAIAASMLFNLPASPQQNAPLPDAAQLMQRAIANEKKVAAEQERYECRVQEEDVETDSKGNVRHKGTKTVEQFFVNGVEIDRTLSKNGKDLSPSDLKKEDEKVMKETVKYTDQARATKENDKQTQQMQDMMQAMLLTNGHRQLENGRSVLYYDIVPNPDYHARNMNQRFAQIMRGTISIDETTGELIDLNIKSAKDLKIAGGMLANLHKGFWIHVHDHPQPDGVWLTDLVEGSGDVRAALFMHPYFRFKDTTGDCHLYTTQADQVGPAKLAR